MAIESKFNKKFNPLCIDCLENGNEVVGELYLCINGLLPESRENGLIKYSFSEMHRMPAAVLCEYHARARRRFLVAGGNEAQEWVRVEEVAGMLRRKANDGLNNVGGESVFLQKLGQVYNK